MISTKEYFPQDSDFPLKGLNTSVPSTKLPGGYSPRLQNVVLVGDTIRQRWGYESLGSLPGTDPVMLLVEFETLAGVRSLVACTTTKQFKWSGSAWTEITTGTSSASPVDWTGSDSDKLDYVIATGTDVGKVLIITNGVDKPRQWDGSGDFEDVTWDLPGFVTCKTLAVYYDYLFIGNVTVSDSEPQHVCWSDTGKFDTWTSGNSGTMLLANSWGGIRKLITLGDRLYAYAENSIEGIAYVGGDVLFSTEQIVQRTQLASIGTIVNLGPFHVFASNEDIMLFDGTRMLRSIGEEIRLTYREELSREYAYRAFGFLDSPKEKLYLFVPISSDNTVVYELTYNVFDLSQMQWVRHEFADRPTAMGSYTRSSTDLWDSGDLTVTWSEDMGIWWQPSAVEGFPIRVVGAVGRVFSHEDDFSSDAGTAMESFYDTPDFVCQPQNLSVEARWIELEFDARGSSVDVWVSWDEGGTYEAIETVGLLNAWTRKKVYFDNVGKTCRIRLGNTSLSDYFQLRWLRVWFTAGAPD